MKIQDYNQMMAYLTRPATPTETPDTRQNFANGTSIIGTNQSGTPAAAQERLKTFVDNFIRKNNRSPGKQELRSLGNFDFYTIKKGIDSGNIKVLENLNTLSQQKTVNEQLLKLSKNKTIDDIFKIGKTTIKDINKVKKVIGNVSNSVAADRLLQLASIYSDTGAEDSRGLNIKPKFKNNATKILKDSPYTGYIRNMNEALIGKSVGDPSIKGTKSKIVQDANYMKTGIAKAYDIDEPLGVASSVNRGSTPYGIYGQIIDSSKNKLKVGWDARKSQLELDIQKAIKSKDKKLITASVKKFNIEAKIAENKFNEGRKKGFKKIVIPEVSLDKPSKTNANYKNLNDDYKKAFNAVHANQGYSFKIPADLKPITQIKQDLKNPKILSKVEKAVKAGAPRLYAKIPGITDLFVMAGSIPGDLARKKYLMAGVKSLGVLATPLIVYGAYDDFNKGIPVAEIIERNLIGTDLVKGTKEYMSLSPEGKEARSVVKQAEIRDQIDQDESMLDIDFDQPTVKSDFNLEEAIAKYKSEQDDFAEDRAAQEGQTTANRKTVFQNLKDRVFGISLDDITKEYYNQGGRVGYADGPKDPKRRTVIKGLTALAALPVIGKYFKLAKSPKAAAAVETVMEKVSGMPDWFQPFVNKVLKMGDDVTDTAATAEREIVKRVDIEDATVDVHYNTATNDVKVEVVGGKNAFGEPLEMQYKAPEVIEETGRKTKGEFSAAESRPVQTSPNDIELDGYETDMLDDLLSETDYLEGFGTGKIRTPAEIKKAKLRAKMREDAQRDPGSLLDDFDD